jgi:2-polyprenyl-3-methyl-5-hydroxy-6-metoxy-1,4-benzoquinol methylase
MQLSKVHTLANPLSISRLRTHSTSPNSTLEAWTNKKVRDEITNYILKENFKFAPEFGRKFVGELNRLCSRRLPEEEIYRELRKFYEKENGHQAIFNQERLSRLKRRTSQVRELLEGKNPNSLLDVGCGSGEITNELMTVLNISSSNVYGLEVSAPVGNHYPFRVVEYDGLKFPKFDKEFDLVTSFSVLHHTEDPLSLIREIKSILHKDGTLIIRECDARTYEEKLFNLIADYLWYKVYTPIDDMPMPGNYLSQKDWSNIFKNEGYNRDGRR